MSGRVDIIAMISVTNFSFQASVEDSTKASGPGLGDARVVFVLKVMGYRAYRPTLTGLRIDELRGVPRRCRR